MPVFVVVVFFVGWIYSIVRFGYFIGFGLGWIPALVIAMLLDFAITICIGLLLSRYSKKREAGPSYIDNLRGGFFWGVRHNAKSLIKYFGLTAMLVAIGAAVYFIGVNELNGTCGKLREQTTSLRETESFMLMRGLDIADIDSLSYLDLASKYGEDGFLPGMGDVYTARSNVSDTKFSLEGFGFCFE